MICNRSGVDTMTFVLGTESVTAVDDGGIGIRYNTGEGETDFQPDGIRPVLCLEVSLYSGPILNSRRRDASPAEGMILS